MDVKLWVAVTERAQQTFVPVDCQVRVVAALHQNAGPAQGKGFLDLLEQVFPRVEIAFGVARIAIERAERTAGDTNIGVVDVSIDDVSDDRVGMEPAPHAVGGERQIQELGILQKRERLGSSEPLSIDRDEEPFRVDLDRMSGLRPAFKKDGTVTAANASKINDGAAALVLTTAEHAEQLGVRPLARLVAQASVAQEPEWFTTAPVKATQKVLERAGLSAGDIDLWEVNEAFAAVAMAFLEELELPADRVNVRGGAVALGHPIGASGLRMLYEMYLQFYGQAGERQIEDPRFGLTHNLGGFPAMNVCSISIVGRYGA